VGDGFLLSQLLTLWRTPSTTLLVLSCILGSSFGLSARLRYFGIGRGDFERISLRYISPVALGRNEPIIGDKIIITTHTSLPLPAAFFSSSGLVFSGSKAASSFSATALSVPDLEYSVGSVLMLFRSSNPFLGFAEGAVRVRDRVSMRGRNVLDIARRRGAIWAVRGVFCSVAFSSVFLPLPSGINQISELDSISSCKIIRVARHEVGFSQTGVVEMPKKGP
jgi:hypothetical protein